MNGGLVSIRDERPHKKLEVWQKTMALVVRIYTLTKEFPKSEKRQRETLAELTAIFRMLSGLIRSLKRSEL
jgi:hypothetical protein